MPYKDPAKQREFQRKAVAAKRARFLAGGCCIDCGLTDDLQLDHRDPTEKASHRIWSWSDERIAAEMAKCDIRCRACHQERHAVERRKHGIGGYQRRKCRCAICVDAKRRANARYLARKNGERPGPESNGHLRLCRPLRNHSATGPEHHTVDDSLAEAA